MAWIALLALLVIAMLSLEAIGAERNFRRRGASSPGSEPEPRPSDWSRNEGVAHDRIGRFPRTRLPSAPARGLSIRHFSARR